MTEHISFDDLSRRTDDLLPPSYRAKVDAHLAECEACRREYETLLWINKSVQSGPWQPIPAGVSFHVPVEENRWSAALRRWGWGRWVTFAAMPALLLLFVGVLYCGSPAGADHCPPTVRTALGRPGVVPPTGPDAVRTSIAIRRAITRVPRDTSQPTASPESTLATEPVASPTAIVVEAPTTATPELVVVGPTPTTGPGAVVPGGAPGGSQLTTGGGLPPTVLTAQAEAWLTLTPYTTSTVTPTVTSTATHTPPGPRGPEVIPTGRSAALTASDSPPGPALPNGASAAELTLVDAVGDRPDPAIVVSLADGAQVSRAGVVAPAFSAATDTGGRGSGTRPAVEITAMGDVFLALASESTPWSASSFSATLASLSAAHSAAEAPVGNTAADSDNESAVTARRQEGAGSVAEPAPRPPSPVRRESSGAEPTATQPESRTRVSPLLVLIVAVASFLVGRMAPAEAPTGRGSRRDC